MKRVIAFSAAIEPNGKGYISIRTDTDESFNLQTAEGLRPESFVALLAILQSGRAVYDGQRFLRLDVITHLSDTQESSFTNLLNAL